MQTGMMRRESYKIAGKSESGNEVETRYEQKGGRRELKDLGGEYWVWRKLMRLCGSKEILYDSQIKSNLSLL